MTKKDRQFTPDAQGEKQPEEKTDNNDNNIDVAENDEEATLSKSGEQDGTVGERDDHFSDTEARIQARIEELEQEKQELTNRLLRLQADFDNYRKRMRMEKEALEEYANFNFIKKLLPVVDNLERASSASCEAKESIVEGLALISRQLNEILAREGVVPMNCQGKPFDPNYHEAVFQEKSPEYGPGIVLEEIQRGYLMKEKILRVSMVKVSSE